MMRNASNLGLRGCQISTCCLSRGVGSQSMTRLKSGGLQHVPLSMRSLASGLDDFWRRSNLSNTGATLDLKRRSFSTTMLPEDLASASPPDELPVFDLAAFRQGGVVRADAVAGLRAACEAHGFLYLKNHGIDDDVLTGMEAAASRFFALPIEDKLKMSWKSTAVHPKTSRGYIGEGEEALDPSAAGDMKQVLDIGREGTLADTQTPFQGPNNWPEALPDEQFKDPVLRHQVAMWDLARELTHAVALSLDLPEKYFDEFLDDPIIIHRINYYPPYRPSSVKQLNCGEHTDYGFLTLLHQTGPSSPLQVYVGDGKWVTAPNIPGMLNVNIGDLMERWSNGKYRATLHRVVQSGLDERFSIPFFYDPNFNAMVEPVPTCVSEAEPALFAPVLAGQRKLAKFEATWSEELTPTSDLDQAAKDSLFKPATYPAGIQGAV